MTALAPQIVAILPVVKSTYFNDTDTAEVTRESPGHPSRQMSPYHPITTGLTLPTDQWHPGPLGTCSNAPELPTPAAKSLASSSSRQAPLGMWRTLRAEAGHRPSSRATASVPARTQVWELGFI